MKSLSNQKLVFSALCIALYIVVMMCTQSFAFGQYQIHIATALYGLSAIFPFLVLPFGLANVVSNTVMGGLGLPDIIGGFIVGIVTTGIIVLAKRRGCGKLDYLGSSNLCTGTWCSCMAERTAGYSVSGLGKQSADWRLHLRYCECNAGYRFGTCGSRQAVCI